MPVTHLSPLLKRIALATWDAADVYQELLLTPDLSEEQKAELKKAYDLREFHQTELLSNELVYNLIPKSSDPRENEIRNSITEIQFLHPTYNLSYLDTVDETKIRDWAAANNKNPSTSILIVKTSSGKGWLRDSSPTFEAIICSEGRIKRVTIKDNEQLLALAAARAGSKDIQLLPPSLDNTSLIDDIYRTNNLHIPFKYVGKTADGKYFAPHIAADGKFSWQEIAPPPPATVYKAFNVNRFIKPEETAKAGKPVWVNDALKCFVLSEKTPSTTSSTKTEKDVFVLWAGTHDVATLTADTETSPGQETFIAHQKELTDFLVRILQETGRAANISLIGHSLGGALAQQNLVLLQQMYQYPEYRALISSLHLGIKNPAGISVETSDEHTRLALAQTLRLSAHFYWVNGDIVQQTGMASTFSCPEVLSSPYVDVSMYKASALFQGGTPLVKTLAYTAAAVGIGAAVTVAAAPATMAAAGWAFFSGAGAAASVMSVAGTVGSKNVHTHKYFLDSLHEGTFEYSNSLIPTERIRIISELTRKVALLTAATKALAATKKYLRVPSVATADAVSASATIANAGDGKELRAAAKEAVVPLVKALAPLPSPISHMEEPTTLITRSDSPTSISSEPASPTSGRISHRKKTWDPERF
jgi:hypothetical protein